MAGNATPVTYQLHCCGVLLPRWKSRWRKGYWVLGLALFLDVHGSAEPHSYNTGSLSAIAGQICGDISVMYCLCFVDSKVHELLC